MKRYFWLLPIVLFLIHACEKPTPRDNGLVSYTPLNATSVIKINDYQAFKSEIINNNFLKELKNIGPYKNSQSLLSSLKYLNPNGTSLLAFNEIGKNAFDYTFITKNHNELFAIDSTTDRKIETLTYENASIKVLSIGDKKIYSTSIDDHFIGSSSKLIIENLIRNNGADYTDKKLLKLYQVAQENVPANIFINHKKGNSFFENVFSGTFAKKLTKFNDWTSFDSSIAQDYIKLNGIAVASDSINNTLNILKYTAPGASSIADITPLNTSYFVSYPLEEKLAEKLGKPSDSLFFNSTEVAEISFNDTQVFAVKTTQEVKFEDILQKYVSGKSSYRDQTIWQLNTDELITTNFSKIVGQLPTNLVAKIGDFYVFTENREVLEDIISNFQNNATLSQLLTYKNLRSELAGESSVLIVGNLEKLKDNNNILSEDFSKGIAKKDFKDYKFTAVQYIAEGDFAHFHALLKKANTSTTSSSLITQMYNTTLDAEPITRPQFLLNHHTKKKEIVIQDADNNLYLISTEGKVLWKKKLDSKIKGDITQVDLYRNGRLQLAFTTADKLMIVDRNGKDVPPFPLSFKNTITQPLAVFDYDKNKNYRFLVVMGNEIKMYDRNASIVSGFTLKKTQNPLINPPEHIRIGNKDYIVMQESDGKLDILHRTGSVRIKLNGKIDFSGNKVYLYNGRFTTTNSSGDLIQIDQKGGINKIELGLKDEHRIDATTKTLATVSENILTVKENKATLDFGIYTEPRIFYLNDKIYVSVTDRQTHQVYLYDSNAKMIKNFPVYGDSAIDMADIDNDKKPEIVTVGDENSIICYKMN
ncbi:ribonuclease HII [Galbibacter sp. EGI 63066]|uniref:ribonuclease HII n=1 Tax=Galbibacter sp. EGI 63066 TaxID=2993559 RepID=UPI0022494ADF|nr:ribonuclease HII [Galbibacter sp. EGI 63066]MCX2679437.1 ribonuclease HII [Galbibacter sp. EGI 63066]